MKGSLDALEEGLCYIVKNPILLILSCPSPKVSTAIYQGNCAWVEKRNNRIFQGFLDIGSELMVFPRDPKYLCGLPVRVGAYGGQIINGVLVQVPLTVGPTDP